MLSGRAYKTLYPQHYIIYKKGVPLLFSYLLLSPERNRNELETYHEQSVFPFCSHTYCYHQNETGTN
jgi:hypothetical protein